MKNAIALLVILFGGITLHAQKISPDKVPAAVRASFAQKFPAAKMEKCEKEGDNYEIEFTANKAETSAVFDASGKWLETEVEMPVAELPKAVMMASSAKAPGKKIKEASKITSAGGAVTYEVEINDIDYIYDSNGNLISQEAEDGPEDGENGED